VITSDVGCRPDRVENPQIGFRRKAEDFAGSSGLLTAGAPNVTAVAAAAPRTTCRRLMRFISEPLPAVATTQPKPIGSDIELVFAISTLQHSMVAADLFLISATAQKLKHRSATV